MDKIDFLEIKSGTSVPRKIAYTVSQGDEHKPGIFWLSGFKSNMKSQKVSELEKWSKSNKFSLCRFDYSGHGESDGNFEDGTISHWLEETIEVFLSQTCGPQLVVGSSMGGWLALLLAYHLQTKTSIQENRVSSLILIAPAWDMTRTLMWDRFTDEIKKEIEVTGCYYRPSAYGDGPYPLTKKLIEDGEKHMLSQQKGKLALPIRILHGMQDPDVPWGHSIELMKKLDTQSITLSLIKDGEHRLSRPEDIDLLFSVIEQSIATSNK